ncbi:hypothetical protein H4R19_005825 [Coemansia spiralis]|nr:hypothetical protein H4R19_005825 [Coemansia spiralis]
MAIGKYAVDEGKWLNKFLDTADDMSGDAGRRVVKILRNIAATGFYRLDATTEFQGFDNRSVTLNCTKLTASAGSGKGGE